LYSSSSSPSQVPAGPVKSIKKVITRNNSISVPHKSITIHHKFQSIPGPHKSVKSPHWSILWLHKTTGPHKSLYFHHSPCKAIICPLHGLTVSPCEFKFL
jgi:hypothetical protein